MKKILTILSFLLISVYSFSQDISGSRVIARQALYPVNGWITGIYNDTALLNGVTDKILTPNAIYDFVLGRIGSVAGGYLIQLTGDVTTVGQAATLATVNATIGDFGSSVSIPTFTVNEKGLITLAGSNVVIAPAGTLSGTTLASNVVSSSLTGVGTITTGVWNGTTIQPTSGGTGQTTVSAGDILFGNGVNTWGKLSAETDGQVLTLVSGLPAWVTVSGTGTVTNVATGYGLIGGPITTTGTLLLDSATVFPQIRATIPDANLIVSRKGTGIQTWYTSGDSLYLEDIEGSTFVSVTKASDSTINIALSATGTPSSSTYLRGDNTWATISAGVAWGGITGTLSDQTDLQTALNLKGNLASPTFTGTVTIPTPFTLGAVSVLTTGTELNFVDGVTSSIQTQLDAKEAALTFTASDFDRSGNTISIDYINGQAASGSVKGFLTSADWTTFNSKAPTASPTFTGTVTIPTPFTLGAVSVLPTGTELNFVDGVTSAIQTQLDGKQPLDADLTIVAAIGTSLQQIRVNAGGTALEYFTASAGGVAWGAITGTLSDQTDLQTALNLKANLASPTFTGTVTIPTPFTLGAVSVLPTGTELNFVDGVTSSIQTQLDAKGVGTVTSVGFTGGLISVATATTTPALTVAGTSGGIPYFSSASTWASSAALTSTALVLGGGAGAAPTAASGATYAAGVLDVTGSGGSFLGIQTVNTNSGAGAFAHIGAGNSSSARIFMTARGTGWTTSGANFQDGGILFTEAALAGGLSIASGSTTNGIRFYTGGFTSSERRMDILYTGEVGIGVPAPTAILHLKAGTATASTAPLKFNTGTLLTTAEAGAVEFLTDAFYGTITTGAARKTFAFLESPIFTGNLTTPTIKITGGAPGAGKILTSDADGDATWETAAGGGDMVLASVQTVTGAKTFNDTKLLLRNVAGTFNGSFVNTNTADRIYTLKDADGTLAFTSDITGTNSGTNTGDQTSIVGITGTLAQFNTAVTDADLAPIASPTFTGTVTIPTPFTLGATSVTSTGTQLNYLSGATGTTGTNTTNLVFSAAPTFTGTTIFSTGIQSATIKSAATGSASNLWIPTSDGATINQTTSQLLFGGGSEVSYRFAEAGSFSTVLGVNDVYASHIIGIQPFTEAASGTHAFAAQLVINPLLGTGGSAATTDAATVFINGAMTGVTPSGRNDALKVDGASYFTGSINNVTITVPTTSATLTLIDGSSLITSGAFATTLTSTATTNATLPAGTNTLYSTLSASITSAQLLASLTNETGTGVAVFGTSPDFTTAITLGGVAVPTISSTNTLTNKRITVRYGTTTSSATPTINTDNVDTYELTAQAEAITSFTTNLSGTPTTDQGLHIIIVGTAARAITWGASFEASTIALPTTTVSTNRLDAYFIWNATTLKWRITGTW